MHLWVKAAPPPEYVMFILYDRFGWTPSEVREQRASDILEVLTIMEVESKVNKQRGKSKR